MIKEQAAYLASLKGNNQASSASQILQRFALAPGLGQLPSLAPNLPYAGGSNKVAIPRQGQQGRSSPGSALYQPRQQLPSPQTNLASSHKLQQLRMGDGSLMWALATGSEQIPGTNKSRTMYKVVAPVVPGQPPPQVIFRPPPPAPAAQPVRRHQMSHVAPPRPRHTY